MKQHHYRCQPNLDQLDRRCSLKSWQIDHRQVLRVNLLEWACVVAIHTRTIKKRNSKYAYRWIKIRQNGIVRTPQKLNCSSSMVPGPGRFVSTSRNVRSNGMVTDESVELRLIKFWPGFTKNVYDKIQWSHECHFFFLSFCEMKSYVHATVNLSNSVIIWRWSRKSIGVPRSSIRGAIKMRHVPIACEPVLFVTLML